MAIVPSASRTHPAQIAQDQSVREVEARVGRGAARCGLAGGRARTGREEWVSSGYAFQSFCGCGEGRCALAVRAPVHEPATTTTRASAHRTALGVESGRTARTFEK